MPTSRGSCRQVVDCGFCYGVTVRLDWVEVASAFVNSRFVLFFFFYFSRVSKSNAATVYALFIEQ